MSTGGFVDQIVDEREFGGDGVLFMSVYLILVFMKNINLIFKIY